MKPIAYGIDYGTSNSVIAVAFEDGTTEAIAMEDGSTTLPSLVFLDRSGARATGSDASTGYSVAGGRRTRCSQCDLVDFSGGLGDTDCLQYVPGSFCLDSRLLSRMKSDLADPAFRGTNSWGRDFPVDDLLGTTFRRLTRRAAEAWPGKPEHVVLGHPVRFVGAEAGDFETLQGLAIERLVLAAGRADIVGPLLVPEPQAALMGMAVDEALVVSLDFGGGTFDVAIMEVVDGVAEVLALDGAPVGGEDIDAEIFRSLLTEPLGLGALMVDRLGRKASLPAYIVNQVSSLGGLRKLLSDPNVAVTLRDLRAMSGGEALEGLMELVHGGLAVTAYKAVEQAKVQLSTEESASVDLFRPGVIDVRVPMSRKQLEELLAPRLDLIVSCVRRALRTARLRPEDAEVVQLTGGSSQIPAFFRAVEVLLPAAEIRRADSFTAVARGLALCGLDEGVIEQ